MANKAQVRTRKRASSGTTTHNVKHATSSQSRSVKNSKHEEKIPKAGEKQQKWIYTGNNAGYYLVPNPYPVLREKDGKKFTDKVFYSEGEPNVFLSELNKEGKEIPRKTPVWMRNSILHVPAENSALQEFMIQIAYFSDKKGFIKLEDQEADALLEEERYELIDSNLDEIKALSSIQRKALAADLMIGFDNITPERAILLRLRKYNEDNPEEVFNKLKDAAVHYRYAARLAVEQGLIDRSGDNLVWTQTGKALCKAPVNGMDFGTYIANTLMEDSSFQNEWLEKIENALS